MRVRALGRQPVRRWEFWAAIIIVVVVLGMVVIPLGQTGHVPQWPRGAKAAILAFLGGTAAWDAVRYGRAAFPRWRVLLLLGSTLFFGADLVPSPGRVSWVKDVGSLLLFGGILFQWVEFGHPRPAPRRDGPREPV